MKNKARWSALTLCLVMMSCVMTARAAAVPEPSWVAAEVRPSVTILIDGMKRIFYDVNGKEVHALYYPSI